MESKHDELKLKTEWQKEAREMTLDKLPDFLKRLAEFDHDYGTVVCAIGAAAVAAAWAVEKANKGGGITGFQASCVNWEFLQFWGHIDAPAAIVRYEDMLFPQYAEKFTSIGKETWEHLQKKAAENLAEKNGGTHPNIAAHWQSIIDGRVPFGFSVRN